MALLIKSLNGLAYASVKSRDGLAVASIKNINGLDATSGGGTPVIAYTDTGVDTTDTTTFTFTNRAVGTAAADRKVIVGVYSRISSGTTLAVSGMTIGGITANLVTGTNNTLIDGATSSHTSIWEADVPTGTTATVVVTMNLTAQRCAIAVWSGTGITVLPPTSDVAVYGQTTNINTAVSLNADVTATSVAVAIAGWAATPLTSSWTGMSEDVDAPVETNTYTAAHYSSTGAETPRTMSVTPSGNAPDRIGSLAVFN